MNVALSVDQILRLRVPLSGREVLCQAQVKAFLGETVSISLPQRHSVKLPINADHLLILLTQEDALYELECKVVAKDAEGLTLELPEQRHRIQRRDYVRVPVSVRCEVEVDYGENKDALPAAPGKMTNLSGGGCGLSFVMAVDPGTRLTIHTELPDEGPVSLVGEVRHSQASISPRGTEYHLGVQFLNISEASRGMIVRAVFAIQRKLLRERAAH